MGKLFDLLMQMFKVCPRPLTILPDEGGVVIRFGKYIETLKCGYYWYWPMITEIEVLNTSRQLIDVDMQDLTTYDGKGVTINMSVEYTVKNPKKALLEVTDYDESIQEVAGNSMREAVGRILSKNFSVDDLIEEVSGYVAQDAKKYGIKVLRVMVCTASFAKTIRLIQ